ncbi:hypothetical protein [Variovorax sp. V15]|uniref:hypothetical protein n=1 Tax=Variovorax sp. V15 TaxID=3065952 RepID=UPI0034E8BDAB
MSTTSKRFPPISAELMNELEKRWPDSMPGLEATPTVEILRFKQGAISVIRFLRSQFDLQNKTVL